MKDRQRRQRRRRFDSTAPRLNLEPARLGEGRSAADGEAVVFGAEPVKELIAAAPETVTKLYLTDETQPRFRAEAELLRRAGGQIVTLDRRELARLAGVRARHQGVVATIKHYRYAALDELLAQTPDPLVVIEGVTDPRNLGAILRSAECAGAKSILLARDRTVGITPAAIKASAGAWVHTRIAQCGNLARTIEDLKARGYWIAALVPGGETSLYQLDTSRRLALVVGAEDRGVRELTKKLADFRVGIPMRGQLSSLNVSVAVAVALFEIARARMPQS